MRRFYFFILLFIVFSASISPSVHSAETVVLSQGQTIYVPAYSHIYVGDREMPFLLTVTLSIRNIDLKHSIKVTTVDYYETQGNLLKKFL